MASWPDTPFKESMLKNGVIIHCPEEDLVRELFQILRRNGIEWYGRESMDNTCWDNAGEDTCYRIMVGGEMKRGNVYCYQDSEYDEYVKCTFYGADSDLEISDTSFEWILFGEVSRDG